MDLYLKRAFASAGIPVMLLKFISTIFLGMNGEGSQINEGDGIWDKEGMGWEGYRLIDPERSI